MRKSRLAMLATVIALLATPVATPAAQASSPSCSAVTALAERPTLREGDSGSCVRVLKNLLLTKGWSMGYQPPTAPFDSATATMLAEWQVANGRPVQAVVDTDTWLAIDASPAKPGYTMFRGPNTSANVVLSFDDCPRSYSAFKSAVLEAEKLNVALVLFPTGACRKAKRFSSTYARTHGHYVFNHSVNHPNLVKLSYSKAYAELGSPSVVTTFGRPPYGSINATVAKAYQARSMQPWMWTYDTEDWTKLSQSTVVSRAVTNATPGSTILMHMQHAAFNRTAIRAIVSGLAERGLKACANYPGKTPSKPTTFRC